MPEAPVALDEEEDVLRAKARVEADNANLRAERAAKERLRQRMQQQSAEASAALEAAEAGGILAAQQAVQIVGELEAQIARLSRRLEWANEELSAREAAHSEQLQQLGDRRDAELAAMRTQLERSELKRRALEAELELATKGAGGFVCADALQLVSLE